MTQKNTMRSRLSRKILVALLTLAMVFAAMPGFTLTAFAASLSGDGTESSPWIVDSSSSLGTATLDPGYYRLEGTFTNSGRLTANGDVHLILADGCNVTVSGGINCSSGNSLTIDGNTGKLTANSPGNENSGIGSDRKETGGTITINGGTVTATGGRYCAGIGGGNTADSGTITINGGTVTATGGDGNPQTADAGGAGIGGSGSGSGGTITINGGTVTATGKHWAAGIGGGGGWERGYGGSGGNITINGGTVNATDGGGNSSGIGGAGGRYNSTAGANIVINGGSIYASKMINQPTNGSESVYLTTLTVSGATDNSTKFIAAGYGASGITANYGVNDVVTRSGGKVYFYLPADNYSASNIAVATSETAMYNNGSAINVTSSGGTGALDNSGSPTLYTATLNVKKNGSNWNNHGRWLNVSGLVLQNKETDTVTAKTFVSSGSFAVYDGATNTGIILPADGEATVNYGGVTYDDNSADRGSVPVDGTTYISGAQATVSGNTGGLAKDGYIFGGWTVDNGIGVKQPGDTFTMPTAAVRLTAIWNPAITAEAINGVTSPAGGATSSTNISDGTGFTSVLTWNNNPGTFDYGTAYTATVTLTASGGYQFSESLYNTVAISGFTVNGIAPVFVSRTANELKFTVAFPYTESPFAVTKTAGEDYSYVSGVLTLGNGTYEISLRTGVTQTDNRIIVDGKTAIVTLTDVNMTGPVNYEAMFQLKNNAAVTLNLVGDNTIKNTSNSGSHIGGAALGVPEGSSVTIQGEGTLHAEASDASAAIGGNSNGGTGENSGDITITGNVEVTAKAGNYGAAIGAGANSAQLGGDISILSGTNPGYPIVTVEHKDNASAIGSSYNSDMGKHKILITGGTVTATGSGSYNWIGGYGYYKSGDTSSGTVEISGGTVRGFTNIYAQNVIITGGSVNIPTIEAGHGGLTNGSANGSANVYLNKLYNTSALGNEAAITDIYGVTYGLTDVKADTSGYLYFWLPASSASELVAVSKDEGTNFYGADYQRVTNDSSNELKLLEATPSASIDYANEKLTGLDASAAYTVNGADKTADTSGNIAIDETWFNTAISIVKKGDNSSTINSFAQSLSIPARPTAPKDKDPQVLSFADGSVSKTYGDTSFTNTLAHSAGDGAVTYRSDDETVATVDNNGLVTIVGKGNTAITATAAATAQWLETSASYTLAVSAKTLTVVGASVDAKTYDGTTGATVTGVTFDAVEAADSPLVLGTDFTASGVFDSADAGNGKTVTVTVAFTSTDKAKKYQISGTYALQSQSIDPAVKAPAKVKVKFKANGGRIGKAKAKTKTVKIKSGKAIGKLPTAKRSHYKFKGWYTKKTGGKKVTAKTKATKDVTLYAHWRKLARYGKVVKAAAIFVRRAPAEHGNLTNVVGYMKAGQTFKIRAYHKGKAKNSGWYVLTYKGKTAYVYAKYVKVVYR